MTIVTPRRGGVARLLLALVLALGPLSAAANGEPEQHTANIHLARPGSRDAATYNNQLRFVERKLGGAFTTTKSGLLVPDKRLILSTAKDRMDQARWYGVRRGVVHYLERSGARLSPEPYQKLVNKIRRRAEYVLRREGKSLGGWEMAVLEGGRADQVNASTWTGGLITIYRPLVDLCYQIADVAVNTSSPTQLDSELWRLSRWRRDKRNSPVPETLKVSRDKIDKRDKIAESILSRVVLHEMGHAASGHVELKDRGLYVPGKSKPDDLARSRAMEREADMFATTLGVKGAVRIPGVMPLFSYYNFISRPTFEEHAKNELDWRTHPIDADRYNSQREVLSLVKRSKGLPLPLERRIILPSGEYATPTKPADVVPIRPPVQKVQPLQKAADRPGR